MSTKIPWTDETWNPVTGCSRVSEACDNCYAKALAEGPRLRGRFGYPEDEPFRVTLHHDKLTRPHNWKKRRYIFPCSMGDLFHDDVPFDFIADIYSVMNQTPQHVYQVLTKRPKRMYKIYRKLLGMGRPPGPHIWHGATVELNQYVQRRLRYVVRIPGITFVSCEPLLGNVNLISAGYLQGDETIDWIIAGCEKIRQSPGRPTPLDHFRVLRDQCAATKTPFWLKQAVVNGRVKNNPVLDTKTHIERPEPIHF